ncbi:hypothetical protein [Methanosphaera sp. ISO3-F5]|uniref:hypothetical protein n=1 Tax=Methanosphaera sp. ISO3-F5 TaxID=1452353 RepID=UPI00396488FD
MFVTYNQKKETISKSAQYEDKLINQKQFSGMRRLNPKSNQKKYNTKSQRKWKQIIYIFIK